MSMPFLTPLPAGAVLGNPRRHNGHAHAPASGGPEAAAARQIRRDVAQRLTHATRAHEQATGAPMPPVDRDALIRTLITEALDEHAKQEIDAGRPPMSPQAESRVARTVVDMMLGAGGLQRWLDHEHVEEITAQGCDQVFVRFADGAVEPVAPVADSDTELVELVRVLAARTGNDERRWDRAAPILNLQLPDGSRLNAVLDVTRRPSLSIRRHRYPTMSLDELLALGSIERGLRDLLAAAVAARRNIMVSGPTGAGKTTFLRALASAIDPAERLVTIEDTYELGLDHDQSRHPNVVAMQARDANTEGVGAVDMATLFRTALRMVPSRVIVGEVRGHEVIPLLNAMSQGNDGSLSTIHASSSAGVFAKLALYAAQAPERLDQTTTNLHIAEGVDLVIQLRLTLDGRRHVTSMREVTGADGLLVASNEIYRPGPDGRAVPGAPMSTGLLDLLVHHGFDPDLLHQRHGWWDTTPTRRRP